MMDMPTPCPQCGEVVEFNDMNPCGTCNELNCADCLSRPWEDCDKCTDEENEIEVEDE